MESKNRSSIQVLSNSIEEREEQQYMSEKDLVRQEYDRAIEDIREGG